MNKFIMVVSLLLYSSMAFAGKLDWAVDTRDQPVPQVMSQPKELDAAQREANEEERRREEIRENLRRKFSADIMYKPQQDQDLFQGTELDATQREVNEKEAQLIEEAKKKLRRRVLGVAAANGLLEKANEEGIVPLLEKLKAAREKPQGTDHVSKSDDDAS